MITAVKNIFTRITNPFFGFRYRAPLNKTFIFPNLYGFMFGGISFVLLLMAMGYANNLLYFFVFFLISVAVTGMWLTNKNVDRIKFEALSNSFLYAKENNILQLHCFLKADRFSMIQSVFQIELRLFDRNHKDQKPYNCELIEDKSLVPLTFVPERRGTSSLPRVELQSSFPFSMLRAWKYFHDTKNIVIYPERRGSRVLPQLSGLTEEERNYLSTDQQGEDQTGIFSHHREYQNNDSVYRIDWKRSAKFNKLFIKKFEDDRSQKQVLSWGMAKELPNFEDKISQLALWIELCEKNRIEYRLLLPLYKTAFGLGDTHYRQCMEHLALLEEKNV